MMNQKISKVLLDELQIEIILSLALMKKKVDFINNVLMGLTSKPICPYFKCYDWSLVFMMLSIICMAKFVCFFFQRSPVRTPRQWVSFGLKMTTSSKQLYNFLIQKNVRKWHRYHWQLGIQFFELCRHHFLRISILFK